MRALFSAAGAFLSGHSPEREHRELCDAPKGKNPHDNGNTGKEKPKELILPGQLSQSEIGQVQESLQQRAKLIVPEAMVEGMDTLQENAGILIGRIAKDGNDPLFDATIRAAERSKFQMKSGNAEKPDTWKPSDQQLVLSELTKDPEGTLLLAQGIEAELEMRSELRVVAEGRMKEVFRQEEGAIPIEQFAATVEGETVDRTRVEELLHMDPLPPRSSPTAHQRREELVHLVIEAVDAVRKQKSFGIASTKVGASSPAEEKKTFDAWRSEYTDRLITNLDTLKQHLVLQLQQRIQRFVDAEAERKYRLYASLPLSPTERAGLQRKDPDTVRSIDGKALAAWGVSIRAIEDEFEDRELAAWCIEDPSRLDKATDAKDLLPTPDQDNFLAEMEKRFKVIDTLEEEGDRFDPKSRHYVSEQRVEQADTEKWAFELGQRIRRILAAKPGAKQHLDAHLNVLLEGGHWSALEEIYALFERYANTRNTREGYEALHRTPGQAIHATLFPPAVRTKLREALDMIEDKPEALLIRAEQAREDFQKLRSNTPGLDRLLEEAYVDEVRKNVMSVTEEIIKKCDAPLCRTLKVGMRMQDRESAITSRLLLAAQRAQEASTATGERQNRLTQEALDGWMHAQLEIQQLHDVVQRLGAVREDAFVPQPDPSKFPSAKALAYFKDDEGRAYYRPALSEAQRHDAWEHERGHWLVSILRTSGALPSLLMQEERTSLREWKSTSGATYDDLLERLAPLYGFEDRSSFEIAAAQRFPDDAPRAARLAREEWLEHVEEELLCRYADWEDHAFPALTAEESDKPLLKIERDLFLHRRNTGESHAASQDQARLKVGVRHAMDANDMMDEEQSAEGENRGQEGPNMRQNLVDLGRLLHLVRSYHEAYPDTPLSAALTPVIADFDNRFTEYEKIINGETEMENPEDDEGFKQRMAQLEQELNDVVDLVKKQDKEALDISNIGKTKKAGFWGNIRFMSLLDIYQMYKNTVEDFKSIWKRNQDRMLEEVGNVFNDAVGNLGKHVPILGSKYLVKLKGYHTRRFSGSELEGVEKWKKAAERIDSHSLLHTLSHVTNHDQIRGYIDLLCDRGEMNWNDEGVWNTLMARSGYSMPVKACHRDDILRDVWLRRMISTIWNDKELYYKWRSSNDSNTNSQKQKYIQTVDQFSNLSGGQGLAGNLEKQLKLYMLWKNRADELEKEGLPPPEFPDDVKPHLYEQVIEYSIKNGKMSMEQKMYYLVQGVATGLLSIERLRSLAGQQGGIINFFPFIEYFYQKNNSLPELQSIARRLTEDDPKDPSARFRPGIKTTLWLHYEVSREEKVRERLNKGSTRIAESMDHEDIPFFITQLDYEGVNNLASVISGQRQKVTPEGWKNAYIGYNSKFKIFANLVKLEDKKLGRLTKADARMLANNLVGYLLMDNLLTQNGDKNPQEGAPPTVTEFQMSVPGPSAADGIPAIQYRRKMIGFMQRLKEAGILTQIKWGQGRLENITLEEFIATDEGGPFRRNTMVQAKKLQSKTLYAEVVAQLEAAILRNPDAFKSVLRNYEEQFLNEGGSRNLNYEVVEKEILRSKELESAAHGSVQSSH
ncbi:MAG: hypothetical protein WCS85_00695 [Candidatus Peribacteraceae bacterium]